MREYGSNINLPSLDNLFSSEQERQDAKLEKIQILPLAELHPFRNHPFQVRDDDEMDKMVDSVKEYGVMTPAIVRPRQDGGYEIVAGHRRCHASQRAGVETMPCIVRDMDDDTAIILMVDSNCQREHILPSEKAKAYEMKLEAIKRQGRRNDLTSGQLGPKLDERRSNQIVAKKAGESVKQTSVYKGYKRDKIEMRGDRAEMSDFPLYLNTVAGGLDRRDQTIGGFSFVVKIYAVPVVEIIG